MHIEVQRHTKTSSQKFGLWHCIRAVSLPAQPGSSWTAVRLNPRDSLGVVAGFVLRDSLRTAARLNPWDSLGVVARFVLRDSPRTAARLNPWDSLGVVARFVLRDSPRTAVRLLPWDNCRNGRRTAPGLSRQADRRGDMCMVMRRSR